jgi:hypothetical protein
MVRNGVAAVGNASCRRPCRNTSGRQRLNIPGAIDLETGKTRMLVVATVDAASTIMVFRVIAPKDFRILA